MGVFSKVNIFTHIVLHSKILYTAAWFARFILNYEKIKTFSFRGTMFSCV